MRLSPGGAPGTRQLVRPALQHREDFILGRPADPGRHAGETKTSARLTRPRACGVDQPNRRKGNPELGPAPAEGQREWRGHWTLTRQTKEPLSLHLYGPEASTNAKGTGLN